MSNAPAMEVVGRRVRVVARAVVVAVRVARAEDERSGDEVEEHGALCLGSAAAGADGDDVEDVRPAGNRDVDAEGAAGRGGRHHRRRRVGVGVRRSDVDGVPGRSRAGDGDGRGADRRVVGGARDGQRCCSLGAGDVAGVRRLRKHDVPAGGEAGREPYERRGRPGERRRRAGGAAVDEADRGEGGIGAEGRGCQVRQLPVLLGDEADAGGEAAHAVEQRCRLCRVARRVRLLAALGRQRRPEMARALPARRPRPAVARAVAVAVPVVAVPTRPVRRRRLDRGVDDLQRAEDVRVVDVEQAEADELEEARVDDLALVERRAAVADVVRDRRVRVARLREPDEVARRVRPGRRHRPALHLPLPGVGDAQPDRSRGRVAVRARELGRGDEPRDLRRDRRRREAALLLPALDAERRSAGGDEVRGRLDVVLVQRRVREPELVRHQDRVGGLVELRPEGVGRDLSVDEAVARHRAVRQLLALEQEQRRGPRRLEVAGGDEACPRLVQVAREHLTVGAEVRVRRIAG